MNFLDSVVYQANEITILVTSALLNFSFRIPKLLLAFCSNLHLQLLSTYCLFSDLKQEETVCCAMVSICSYVRRVGRAQCTNK